MNSGQVDIDAVRTLLRDWIRRFRLHMDLREHVVEVLLSMPANVRDELVVDARFGIIDYEPGEGTFVVPMAVPGKGYVSRCVVLKRTLIDKPQAFIRWVIAHEMAHAYLRNDGRTAGEDPEYAADALADQWGFPKPEWRWTRR